MADVQTRSSRGRSRGRGGMSRGGVASRTASKSANASQMPEPVEDPLEAESELGQLKKHYNTQLSQLKELFPDWTLDDLVFALQETDGDLETTIERITEGSVSRFNDVKKKPREKSRVKSANELSGNDAEQTKAPGGGRGGRGRGSAEAGRGGRGRGTDRGRGGARGGRGGAPTAVNGGRAAKTAAPTTDNAAWDTGATGSWDQPTSDSWGGDSAAAVTAAGNDAPVDDKSQAASDQPKSSVIPEGSKKSWASMLARPTAAPAIPKQAAPAGQHPPDEKQPTAHEPIATDWGAQQATDGAAVQEEATPVINEPVPVEASETVHSESLPPPKDDLTEDNLENLPDQSGPPTSETVASTRDARSTLGTHGSYQASQQTPSRPTLGGYATSAQKLASHSNRSLSFQKLKEQQDAVVMPGNHAIDRSAVQFGSMNLGDGFPADVDEEREDAETRTQPPQQSPSQPRASLPPAPRAQQAPTAMTSQELPPTTKQAPGLPMPGQSQSGSMPHSQPASGAHHMGQPSLDSQPYSQYGGRYGHGPFGQEQQGQSQKPFDPFNSQLYPQSQNEPQTGYSDMSQAPGQMSQTATSQPTSYSQMQSEYASHYPGETTRNYPNYYGNYNQHATSMQENVPPQRSTSGFGAGDAAFGGSHGSQPQSRFAEGQASGNNTPNPPTGSQQHGAGHSQHHQQHMHQQGHGHSAFGGHPGYGGPYSQSGYYQPYGHQGYSNYYGYNQHGYGGGYGGKQGMYGGPGHHAYQMSGHGSYDNTSSPATTGAFTGSSLPGRESSMSSGLNDYPRSGSTQPPSQPQHGATSSGFGGMNDNYGRSASGFGGHGQSFGTPSTNAEDSIKPLHDSKTGPSPLGQAGRPGSAFNSNNSHQGSGPGYGGPPSNQQGGFGSSGYPSHLNALHSQYGSSGYGGIGGLGGHGASHGNQSGYGGYSGGAFGNSSYQGRGGWGGQYGSQYGQH